MGIALGNRVRLLVIFALLSEAAISHALAAPPGRDWTPIRALLADGHAGLNAQRFEPTTSGRIELVATGFGGPDTGRTYGFEWRDSVWVKRWNFASSRPISRVLPLANPDSIQMLAYSATTGNTDCWCGVRFVRGAKVTAEDSVGIRNCSSFAVSGAASRTLVWASAPEVGPSGVGVLLALRSKRLADTMQTAWTRIPPPPDGGRASIIASLRPMDDTTCLVVWTQNADVGSGLWWGLIGEDRWIRAPELVQFFYFGGITPIRSRTNDSLFVFYGSSASNSVYRNFSVASQTWGPLVAVYWSFASDLSRDHIVYETDASQDGRPFPTLAALSYSTLSGATYAHVAVADSGQYGVGKFVPGTLGAGSPFIARDENGDVWLAWSKPFPDSVYWLHTFATSTCDAPSLEEASGRPRLRWTLTERTPESAWRVLRSVGGGPFEPLERVIAKDDVTMSWEDSTAPGHKALRYRIRRECRDVRYVWESDVSAEWLPRTARLGLALRSENPVRGELRLELTGAPAGALEIQVLDLQGRTIASQRVSASGLGRDRVSLPTESLSHVRPGLYLVRARSSAGAVSSVAKVALFR